MKSAEGSNKGSECSLIIDEFISVKEARSDGTREGVIHAV